jgi:hypothetical protein
MQQYLEFLGNLSQALAALGLVTVILSMLKRSFERRRWREFRYRMDEWTDRLRNAGMRLDSTSSDEVWRAECERKLFNAGFSPLEIPQVLDLSVAVAKELATSKFLV